MPAISKVLKANEAKENTAITIGKMVRTSNSNSRNAAAPSLIAACCGADFHSNPGGREAYVVWFVTQPWPLFLLTVVVLLFGIYRMLRYWRRIHKNQ